MDNTVINKMIFHYKPDDNRLLQRKLDTYEVLEEEYFGCHPCINTSTLKIRIADILNKFLPYAGHEPIFVEL